MGFDITFDPGLNATGYCAAQNRKVIECANIYPASDCVTEFAKLRSIMIKTHGVISVLAEKYGPLERAGVEKWQTYYIPKSRLHTMDICADVRGILLGVCLQYTGFVIDINKESRTKDEAQQHADRLGIKAPKDARDALHLAICEGFVR